MHLILVSIEASLRYLQPAAVFSCTESGDFARRLAAFRLPVWTIAITDKKKAFQDLLFSNGVFPQLINEAPESWVAFTKDWVRKNELPGSFAILTVPASVKSSEGAHHMEVIDL